MSVLAGFGLTLIGLILIIFVGAGVFYTIFTQSFPSLDLFEIHYSTKPSPTRFFARNGETLLFTLAYEDFESRTLSVCETDGEGCFPKTFLDAAAITRKTAEKQGEKSSLAEEMVRSVYAEYINGSLWPDLAAGLLGFQVKRTFGEDQITGWYYNSAWFGQMAFGLDAAARLYLDKKAEDLNDAECILMSAIVNAPMLNPIDSKGALRDFYLSQLADLQRAGLFSDEKADELARSNFVIFIPPRYLNGAEPDIITRKALNAVINLYGREQVERGGMDVITSEDVALQEYLRCITSNENNKDDTACPLADSFPKSEIRAAAEMLQTASLSFAVLDVNSGQILGELEASVDNEKNRIYDTALQTYRVGSAMNLFAALTAFSAGSSPSTLLWDLENSYGTPQHDGITEPYHGPVQLREALIQNYRRPLTAHLQRLGKNTIQQNAALFGLSGSTVSMENDILFQDSSQNAEVLAYALIPFAASGYQNGNDAGGAMHPVSILRVEKETGETEYPQAETRKALIADNLAYLVHNVFLKETDSFSLPDRPSAVILGNSEGDPGLWISGYTTGLSCAVHITDPQIASAFVSDGSRIQETAEILWRSVMDFVNRDMPVSGWTVPNGISQVQICLPSGKLPSPACQETMTDIFLKGNEPYEYDDYYVEVPVNRENRMLATRFTPFEDVVNEVFLNLPEEAAEWASENGIEQVPAAYDPIRNKTENNGIQIESPEEFMTYSGDELINVIVRLELDTVPESMQLSIGKGMYPDQWQEVCNGGSMENGRWLLCSLDPSAYDPGLYVMRAAFTLPGQAYRSAETYFEIN